jgi:hypothetical protein
MASSWLLGSRVPLASLLPLLLVAPLAGCDCEGTPTACRANGDCGDGRICIDMRCVPHEDPSRDGGPDARGSDATIDASCESPCGTACCGATEICFASASTCIPDRGPCADADDCGDDTYCAVTEGAAGICVPFGVPPGTTSDTTCTRSIDIDAITPDLQCSWTGPPAGDAFPSHFQVMSTPVVVDFDFDDDPATLRPSIIFTTFPSAAPDYYRAPGVLRVIDGATCAHQFTLAGPTSMAMSPAGPAVGDLDGDGRAEIVLAAQEGGLLAWGWDAASSTFALRWRSGACSSGSSVPDTTGGIDQWAGPSIHDLDDDGVPELIYGATVYRASDGCIIGAASYPAYSRGVVPVIADVDEDGAMELVQGDGVYAWSGSGWVLESYSTAAGLSLGQVAVANLGTFPLASFGGADRAEIAVVSAGTVRVQTLEGTVVFGPITIPGGGTGGAPTIADFDGDGRREVATAGGTQYVVLDLDCVAGGDPARCGGTARTDGILWAQPSQDGSSNVTGSSVFDFDADGAAEAVYADECFLRIYDGATGEVRYSAARSSGTTYENPVIVDVDGDFHTEIVSAANDYATGLVCPSTDPLRPDATYSMSHGIIVLRDVMDRWAASRPVWNQHAYAVTHVGDHGESPRSSAVAINWRDGALNNFRQNVQGDLAALGTPDLTASELSDRLRLPCDAAGMATLRARVCNRGALPMAAGFEVSFRSDSRDGPELCRASSATFLAVGMCDEVECVASLPSATSIDVFVVADPDSTSEECHEENNWGVQPNVACDSVD